MPKTYHCWRCKTSVPLMTEGEWEEIHPFLQNDLERIKRYRIEHGAGLQEALAGVRREACDRYFELTGFRETNPDALWHHRLSAFGPECSECGHLLRTSKAAFCANCGASAATGSA
jgi:hypothetical protein